MMVLPVEPEENGSHNHEEQEVEPEEVVIELLGVESLISGSWLMVSKGPVIETIDQHRGHLRVAHGQEGHFRTSPVATWAMGVEPLMALIIIIIIIIIIISISISIIIEPQHSPDACASPV